MFTRKKALKSFEIFVLFCFMFSIISINNFTISNAITYKEIPGKIEAEDFDFNTGTQVVTSTEGTGSIGGIDIGDAFGYYVNVKATGSYLVEVRVMSEATIQFRLKKLIGTNLTTLTTFNSSSTVGYETLSSNIKLNAGQQMIKIFALTSKFKVNWLKFTLINSITPSPTPTNTPSPTPTKTPSPTPTNTSSSTPTKTPSPTPTNTSSSTPTNTPSSTPTNTSSSTPTKTPSPTPTYTQWPNSTVTQTPTATPSVIPTDQPIDEEIAEGEVDLACQLNTDKTIYKEDQEVVMTLKYKNITKVDVEQAFIKIDIPRYTTVVQTNGGIVENNKIKWVINKLIGNQEGEIVFKVKVAILANPEEIVDITSAVASAYNIEAQPDDNVSNLKLMFYSKTLKPKEHKYYIQGFPDGQFKPSSNISREQVAVILARVSEFNSLEFNDKTMYFTDVNGGWAYKEIGSVFKNGLMTGGGDGKFKPKSSITRAEMAAVLVKYLNIGASKPLSNTFNDIGRHWAKSYIEDAYRLKLISSSPDGNYYPERLVTRAEFVTMMNRALFRGSISMLQNNFKDIQSNNWAYGCIQEASNTHNYIRLEDGREEQIK